MLTRFYEGWKYARGISLIAAGLLALVGTISGHSWGLEIEYTGPGSEADSMSRDLQDRNNREAAERYGEGSTDPNDAKGASDYERDHGV